MRKEILALTLVALFAGAIIYNSRETSATPFDQWKQTYGANWAASEESYRRMIFEQNLAEINRHNADETQTYKKGINQFTALTQEEFANTYLNPMQPPKDLIVAEEDSTPYVGGDIDWVSKGKVSSVKNQGQCVSGYAFSATGAMESMALIRRNQSVNLSEQQLVDCSGSFENYGCNGGRPDHALGYAQYLGIASQSEYPYTARDGPCIKKGGDFEITNYTLSIGCDEIIKDFNFSPVSVTVDANNWSSYRSGVFSNCGKSINHAVLLVGIVGGNWKIKNSWGTGWGESGYIRLESAGQSTCGMCDNAGLVPGVPQMP